MGISTSLDLDKQLIGKVIRRLRKERGLSQEVLSGFAGLARSHLSMIEAGSKNPNFDTIWRISVALDILPSEFVRILEDESIKTQEN